MAGPRPTGRIPALLSSEKRLGVGAAAPDGANAVLCVPDPSPLQGPGAPDPQTAAHPQPACYTLAFCVSQGLFRPPVLFYPASKHAAPDRFHVQE